MERWGVVISDLHSGGITALRPPDATIAPGEPPLPLGPLTQQLWNAWCAAIKDYRSPDFLIVGGDNVNGWSRKNAGQGNWTLVPLVQGDTAVRLVNQWNAGVVYGVEGTEYHIDTWNADEYVMKNVSNAADYKGRFAPPDWNINIAGATIHVSHYMGGTKVFQYRGTPPARELTMNLVMSKETEVYKANLILRGHVHHFYEVRASRNSRCCTIPCWQARTDYEAKRNPFVWMPQIGFLLVEVKDGFVSKCEPILAENVLQRPIIDDFEERRSAIKARRSPAAR